MGYVESSLALFCFASLLVMLRSFAYTAGLPMTSLKNGVKNLSGILIFEDPSLRSGCPSTMEKQRLPPWQKHFSAKGGHPEQRSVERDLLMGHVIVLPKPWGNFVSG